jgi:hypothetical protein
MGPRSGLDRCGKPFRFLRSHSYVVRFPVMKPVCEQGVRCSAFGECHQFTRLVAELRFIY